MNYLVRYEYNIVSSEFMVLIDDGQVQSFTHMILYHQIPHNHKSIAHDMSLMPRTPILI